MSYEKYKNKMQVKGETSSKPSENLRSDEVSGVNNDSDSISKIDKNGKEFNQAVEQSPPIKREVKTISLSYFSKYEMNEKLRKELKEMKYLYDGLIVKNQHTILVGSAGAGKTTVTIHLCYKMVEDGYTVIYLYLDGDLTTASKISQDIEDKNLNDNFKLLVDGTMDDYKKILDDFIEAKESLEKVIFVLDTFKFFTKDINNKNANKEAMHYVKDVCKLGATFISLSHTNKDGKRESGTAEIVQDSDAVLRIDGMEDGKGKYISTIKKGGRCRGDRKETSFSFYAGNPLSVEVVNSDIDIEKEIAKREQETKDKYIIEQTKEILRDNPNINQGDLKKLLKEELNLGGNTLHNFLKRHKGTHWTVDKEKGGNSKLYNVNDTEMDKSIERLANALKSKTSNIDIEEIKPKDEAVEVVEPNLFDSEAEE